MAQISAADVAKLRKLTGAGMMDCKKALEETDGDFNAAIDTLRKRGQKVAAKRADREASEGVILADVTKDGKRGAMVVLNCETDFVARNQDFINFTSDILAIAINSNPATLEELKQLPYKSGTINDEVFNLNGVIGEKIELSYYDKIDAELVSIYIHPGNKLASMVGFSKSDFDIQASKDIAMQVAAMNPVAVDKESVSQEMIDKELEIGKALAINEGKPESMAEGIAKGRLTKFFKESTLLSQDFIKNNKISVGDYLATTCKDLKITEFKRYSLAL